MTQEEFNKLSPEDKKKVLYDEEVNWILQNQRRVFWKKYLMGTSITPVSTKGGVVRVIDSATGDVARTTSGWIEDEKYKFYAAQSAANWSAEFDSAETRTGRLTLKLSATDVTGKLITRRVPTGGVASFAMVSKYCGAVVPNTSYVFKCYAKTNNVATNAVYAKLDIYDAAGSTTTPQSTNKITGTNDWTLITKTFTTGATDAFIDIQLQNSVAGNISDAWFDVNSMTLEEVSSITNSSSSPAYYYPSVTAVTSTDNIDWASNLSGAFAYLPTQTGTYRWFHLSGTIQKSWYHPVEWYRYQSPLHDSAGSAQVPIL